MRREKTDDLTEDEKPRADHARSDEGLVTFSKNSYPEYLVELAGGNYVAKDTPGGDEQHAYALSRSWTGIRRSSSWAVWTAHRYHSRQRCMERNHGSQEQCGIPQPERRIPLGLQRRERTADDVSGKEYSAGAVRTDLNMEEEIQQSLRDVLRIYVKR